MKNDLIEIFGSQLRWFSDLNRKHRLYVLYFVLSFFLLFTTVSDDNLLPLFCIALNFGNSVRLINYVPIDKLKN